MTAVEDRLCAPAQLPDWMTVTGPVDYLDPAAEHWRDQPRDEHGLWVKADARARRRGALAALEAGEHVTVYDLPPDPDVVRTSLFSGAVLIYSAGSTTVRVDVARCPHGIWHRAHCQPCHDARRR